MTDKKDKRTKSTLRKRLLSYAYAARGIVQLFKTEFNAWVHLSIALCTVVLGFVFNLSGIEWVAIALSCGLVLGAEAMNTAVEYLANCYTTQKNEQIRKVKDIAAGAVLIAALAALVVGLIIFIPKFLSLITGTTI